MDCFISCPTTTFMQVAKSFSELQQWKHNVHNSAMVPTPAENLAPESFNFFTVVLKRLHSRSAVQLLISVYPFLFFSSVHSTILLNYISPHWYEWLVLVHYYA